MPFITLLAHNIRSAHNVGSIFRTADGFGVERIVLSGYTPYPRLPNDTRLPHESEKITSLIHKTALGAEAIVPFEHLDTLDEWLKENSLSDNPLSVYALEQSSTSRNIGSFNPGPRFALLLGEEVHGIEPSILEQCDHILEIPMHGEKESFNVSVATGIALYALTT